MNFIGLQVNCDEEKREFIIAELSLLAFDAFEENEKGVFASCDLAEWNEEEVKEICNRYELEYSFEEIEKVNWNEEWEKNYDPVIVDDQCIVRATFHEPKPEFPYEIIITPKMSFGTGHHATTNQVLKYQLSLDHEGKKVLDVGCGTGALAIMAHKRGAQEIAAVDIDEWCIENSSENFALNNCENILLKLGGIEQIQPDDHFDFIFANINKNVLIDQIKDYAHRLVNGGTLVLSGFYAWDIPDLVREGRKYGLEHEDQSELENWAMLAMRKK
ncbi:50S ribosomal protein L11 methyltransferase [Marinoscillum sp. MHG1-6]|uniref:50S ribosomal protein L11 methyltransferase n=1 Tax=Marinoscillum sp. MHG1-6 TaxID=2959627 RepID=UPI0021582A2E|nr:50S ribosomal protein L11 methyltransferase [Marinoscillum sp. MHG1-6]